jgi:elongation factor P--beta-lysine ligase
MAKYITWLGQLGAIKAANLQPYLSAVNGFFKDHGLEDVTSATLSPRSENDLPLHMSRLTKHR